MWSCVWIRTDWNVTLIKKYCSGSFLFSEIKHKATTGGASTGEQTGGTFRRGVMRAGETFSRSVWWNFDLNAETNRYYRTAGIDGWEWNVNWMVAKDKWRSWMPQEISEWAANCVCRQFHALVMLLKCILPIIFNVCTDHRPCFCFASLSCHKPWTPLLWGKCWLWVVPSSGCILFHLHASL